jgi:AbrB family looped-hinge helix DNA binding protein
MKAVVSEKGQVTIPKRLRQRLGLRAGQLLEFREEQGALILTKASSDDPVESVYGILATRSSTDELITSMRGQADTV